jgi:hypothetical protein
LPFSLLDKSPRVSYNVGVPYPEKESTMKPKEVLAVAEDYATLKGNYTTFNDMFIGFRGYYNIRESVRKTLYYMYGEDTCEMLIGEKV